MANTKIQWSDAVWNPTVGCTRVSPGCEHCYAERVAHRGMQDAHQRLTRMTARGPAWNGKVRLLPERLEQPLRWRKPRRVFVDSMSDLFHPEVPDDFIDRVFAVMAVTPQHTYQVLTKRPERMARWVTRRNNILRNVWLMTSVEDQERADERISHLLETPAAVRGLSVEPLLGPVRIHWKLLDALDWIIVGGESGPGARPCRVEWIRDIVRQCREAGVPCFVKQDSGRRPGQQGRIPDEDWIKEYPDAHA